MSRAFIIAAALALTTAGAAHASILCDTETAEARAVCAATNGGRDSLSTLGADAPVSVTPATSAVRDWKADEFPAARMDSMAAMERVVAAGAQQESGSLASGLEVVGPLAGGFDGSAAERGSRLLGNLPVDHTMALSGSAGMESLRLSTPPRPDESGAAGRSTFNAVFTRAN